MEKGLIRPNAKTPYWNFDVVVEGKRERGSTGERSQAAAERYVRNLRREMEEEAVLRRRAAERNDMLWEDAARIYFDERGLSKKQYRADLRRVEWVTDQLGPGVYVSTITDKVVSRLLVQARKLSRWGLEARGPLSTASVNLFAEIVRRVLRHVRFNHEVYLPKEPRFGKHFTEVPPRIREMMIAEEIRMEPVRPDLWPTAQFILVTGLRKEAAFIRWSQVHWSEGVIHVVSKGDKFQEVPITPEIEELLRAAKGKNDEFVWTWQAKRDFRHRTTKFQFKKGNHYPLTSNAFTMAWYRMRAKAKVEDLRVHDIRKTTGARMVRATGDLAGAARRLNHANAALTAKHYAHISRDDERERMMQTAEASRKWRERHFEMMGKDG